MKVDGFFTTLLLRHIFRRRNILIVQTGRMYGIVRDIFFPTHFLKLLVRDDDSQIVFASSLKYSLFSVMILLSYGEKIDIFKCIMARRNEKNGPKGK